MKNYPIWSYLSISAIDAPLISIAWYIYFTRNSIEVYLKLDYCIILGVSVWLSYMADRLFDVRSKDSSQLISLRHKFCKENEFILWILWLIILIIIVIFSLYSLNSDKIFACISLIPFILLYNYLNQYLSQKRFPKELCVAILFSYGTLLLIDNPFRTKGFIDFTLICFLNCLILTHKERHLDNVMKVNSWTHKFTHQSITNLTVFFCIYFLVAFKGYVNPFLILSLICLFLHSQIINFDNEKFRFTIETTYALVPLLGCLFDF